MLKWFTLSDADKKVVLDQTASKGGLPATAVEKDLWVTIVLQAIYSTEIGPHVVFKGGTSLSKAWGLIDRFSEDIDLAVDRSFLGYPGELSGNQIKKLREKSYAYVKETFTSQLINALKALGAANFDVKTQETEAHDTDPLAVEIHYPSLTEKIQYLQPRILIEISARSLIEPFDKRPVKSFVFEQNPDKEFSPPPIEIPAVIPTRTMLEKVFLLHEEYQKEDRTKIRSERMTRHLYDINRIQESPFLEQALGDEKLYRGIVRHRSVFTKLKYIDYKLHAPKHINFIPPADVIKEWEKDYALMRENMFYGEVKSFEALMTALKDLQSKINQLGYTV